MKGAELQEPVVLPSPDKYRQPVMVQQKIVIFADKETEEQTNQQAKRNSCDKFKCNNTEQYTLYEIKI